MNSLTARRTGVLISACVLLASLAGTGAQAASPFAPRRIDFQPTASNKGFVQWRDSSFDETGFKVEWRTAGSSTFPNSVTVGANATLTQIFNLAANTRYEFRVTALRTAGDYASDVVSGRTTPTASGVTPALNRVFFVDDSGVAGNQGTEASPWPSLQYAADRLVAGDTVLVRTGNYTSSTGPGVLSLKGTTVQSGSSGKPITYKAYPGERPVIRPAEGQSAGIQIDDKAYIIIDGFEVAGTQAAYTYSTALALAQQSATAPDGKTRSNGIAVGAPGLTAVAHHVLIRNNIIHDNPAAGISAFGVDHIYIEDNEVYNNAFWSPDGTSGITINSSRSDGTTGSNDGFFDSTVYANAIVRNFTHDNVQYIPLGGRITDGNGIILDRLNDKGYTKANLVANNISYNNGGRGIHVFNTQNVDVVFNTAYQNSRMLGPRTTGDLDAHGNPVLSGGELSVSADVTSPSKNVILKYNIAYALPDKIITRVGADGADQAVTFSRNIFFPQGGALGTTTGVTYSNDNQTTDPNFDSAGQTGFRIVRLGSVSAAIGLAGAPTTERFWQGKDYTSVSRPQGTNADVGALERY